MFPTRKHLTLKQPNQQTKPIRISTHLTFVCGELFWTCNRKRCHCYSNDTFSCVLASSIRHKCRTAAPNMLLILWADSLDRTGDGTLPAAWTRLLFKRCDPAKALKAKPRGPCSVTGRWRGFRPSCQWGMEEDALHSPSFLGPDPVPSPRVNCRRVWPGPRSARTVAQRASRPPSGRSTSSIGLQTAILCRGLLSNMVLR